MATLMAVTLSLVCVCVCVCLRSKHALQHIQQKSHLCFLRADKMYPMKIMVKGRKEKREKSALVSHHLHLHFTLITSEWQTI